MQRQQRADNWSEKYPKKNKMNRITAGGKLWKNVTEFFNKHRVLRGMVSYSILWPGMVLYI